MTSFIYLIHVFLNLSFFLCSNEITNSEKLTCVSDIFSFYRYYSLCKDLWYFARNCDTLQGFVIFSWISNTQKYAVPIDNIYIKKHKTIYSIPIDNISKFSFYTWFSLIHKLTFYFIVLFQHLMSRYLPRFTVDLDTCQMKSEKKTKVIW